LSTVFKKGGVFYFIVLRAPLVPGTVYAVLNEHCFALVVILQSILRGCFHFYGIFVNIIILLYNKSLLFNTIFLLL